MLTRAQGLRIIVTWALFFALVFVIGTLPVLILLQIGSVRLVALLILLVFCGGAGIFALLAWLVVVTNNQSVRARQRQDAHRAAGTSSTSGGRYGS